MCEMCKDAVHYIGLQSRDRRRMAQPGVWSQKFFETANRHPLTVNHHEEDCLASLLAESSGTSGTAAASISECPGPAKALLPSF